MSIFSDIGNALGKICPWIVSALPIPGPLGAIASKAIQGVLGVNDVSNDSVTEALAKASPEVYANLKKADQEFSLQCQALGYKDIETLNALAVQNASDINMTMQTEAKSEHWVTYSWRPCVGFAIAFIVFIIGVTICTAYAGAMFYGKIEPLQQIPGMLTSLSEFLLVVSPIVGIASWFRGKKQVAEVNSTP